MVGNLPHCLLNAYLETEKKFLYSQLMTTNAICNQQEAKWTCLSGMYQRVKIRGGLPQNEYSRDFSDLLLSYCAGQTRPKLLLRKTNYK